MMCDFQIPQEIQEKGLNFVRRYMKALNRGKCQVYRARIMLVGNQRVGKTHLRKNLLSQVYDKDRDMSTNGIEKDVAVCNITKKDGSKLEIPGTAKIYSLFLYHKCTFEFF